MSNIKLLCREATAERLGRGRKHPLSLGSRGWVASCFTRKLGSLTPPQIDAFRKLSQPAVRAYLDKEVSKEWTEKLMAAVDAYNKGKK